MYCVRAVGIEPTTSVLSGQRSTTELRTHAVRIISERRRYIVNDIRTAFYHSTTHAD